MARLQIRQALRSLQEISRLRSLGLLGDDGGDGGGGDGGGGSGDGGGDGGGSSAGDAGGGDAGAGDAGGGDAGAGDAGTGDAGTGDADAGEGPGESPADSPSVSADDDSPNPNNDNAAEGGNTAANAAASAASDDAAADAAAAAAGAASAYGSPEPVAARSYTAEELSNHFVPAKDWAFFQPEIINEVTGPSLYGFYESAAVALRNQVYGAYDVLSEKIRNLIEPDVFAQRVLAEHVRLYGSGYTEASAIPSVLYSILGQFLNQPAIVDARGGKTVNVYELPGVRQAIANGAEQAHARWEATQQDGGGINPARLIVMAIISYFTFGAGAAAFAAEGASVAAAAAETAAEVGAESVIGDVAADGIFETAFSEGGTMLNDFDISDVLDVAGEVGGDIADTIIDIPALDVGDIIDAGDFIETGADAIYNLPEFTGEAPSIGPEFQDVSYSGGDDSIFSPNATGNIQTYGDGYTDVNFDASGNPTRSIYQGSMEQAINESIRPDLAPKDLTERSIFDSVNKSDLKNAFDVVKNLYQAGNTPEARSALMFLNSQLTANGQPPVDPRVFTSGSAGAPIARQPFVIIRGGAGPSGNTTLQPIMQAVEDNKGALMVAAALGLAYSLSNNRSRNRRRR